MANTYKSSSEEQQYAENIIFAEIEKVLGITLTKNPKIYLNDNKTHIQPDFYSETNCIVGEIFSHIGNYKVGQSHKIASDILKMLLLDKVKNKKHRKIFAVCSDEEKNKLENSSSWLSESIKQFEIKIIKIDISDDLKEKILSAQNRQKMVNN